MEVDSVVQGFGFWYDVPVLLLPVHSEMVVGWQSSHTRVPSGYRFDISHSTAVEVGSREEEVGGDRTGQREPQIPQSRYVQRKDSLYGFPWEYEILRQN